MDPKLREMLITTTIVVVLFTVFVQVCAVKFFDSTKKGGHYVACLKHCLRYFSSVQFIFYFTIFQLLQYKN